MNPTNEYIKQKWGDRPQIDLAKAIANAIALENGKECGEKDYEQYKGYVNKWFKSDQEPGKHYLLLLSKILNVSVEAILRGADITNEYGDRPTSYSAAKSGDPNIIDRLFGNYEADVWLHTTDEYGKSFLDYVIEFNNYSAFKIAIEKGYGYPVKSNDGGLQLGQGSTVSETDYKLTQMIIENDDKEMFIRAFEKDFYGNKSPLLVFYNHSFLMQNDVIFDILNTTDILKWLLQNRCLSKIEQKELTHINISEHEYLQHIIDKIPSVFCGFNYLLKLCIENNLNKPLELMLEQAINTVREITEILKENKNEFEVVEYYASSDMVIQLKDRWRGNPLGFVPYVEDYSKIKDEELRQKAIWINEEIDQLRREK